MKHLFFAPVVALLLLTVTNSSAQTKPKVLAELFRNTNCANCRQPDEEFEAYVRANPDKGIVEIFYHNSITNPQDPFYLASKTDVDARSNSYYKIVSNPTAIISGVNKAERSNVWITGVEAAEPLSADVSVSASALGSDMYKIDVDVTATSGQAARLFIALTESGIMFDNNKLYGNPGDKPIWDNIFRQMLPTKDGSDVFTLSGTQHFSYQLDLNGKSWNVNNMTAIAIVQPSQPAGTANYPVIGLAVRQLSNLAVRGRGALSGLFEAHSMRLTQTAVVRISDVLGREILSGNMTPEALTLKLSTLPAGAYLLEASAEGRREIRKFVR